jgi:putative effector of murein hydrolase LrgA (UPF0299 family)
MKIKLSKTTIEAMFLSIAFASFLTVLLAFLSLMGWGAIWGMLVVFLYPIAEACRKFWIKHKCRFVSDFIDKLAKESIEEEKTSSIEVDPYW